jgi:hypothetical protein
MSDRLSVEQIPATVHAVIKAQKIWDIHTHLYPPSFGTPASNASGKTDPAGLMLWGIDELVNYHYLVAEVYRVVPSTVLPYEKFWGLTKTQQADHIWKHLFVQRTPLGEACRGVLTTLQKLGLDPNEKTLEPYRKFFSAQEPSRFIDKVMALANISTITMTNNVFDDNERARWLKDASVGSDPRFRAVLRFDDLVRDFPSAAKKLARWGYKVTAQPNKKTVEEVRRFLNDWLDRQKAIYAAVSLPPEFRYPATGGKAARAGQIILEKAVLPSFAQRKLAFAMMIGSRRLVNPSLRDAGDMVGVSDVSSVVNLCREFPANKFLVTMLSRENQHELAVAARKFDNLVPFGCWWFLNIPSQIDQMTRLRLELLGSSFIPQHSDARVLDQLVYKWDHSRGIIAEVLADMYLRVVQTGRRLFQSDIEGDVRRLFHDNFVEFLAR